MPTGGAPRSIGLENPALVRRAQHWPEDFCAFRLLKVMEGPAYLGMGAAMKMNHMLRGPRKSLGGPYSNRNIIVNIMNLMNVELMLWSVRVNCCLECAVSKEGTILGRLGC
jgi:hypothetical protein